MRRRFNENISNDHPVRVEMTRRIVEFAKSYKGQRVADRIETILRTLSDDEFANEHMMHVGEKVAYWDELLLYLRYIRKISTRNIIQYTECFEPMPYRQSKELWTIIDNSSISDTIELELSAADEFIKLYDESVDDITLAIPSDIFFSGTVPLKQCKIEFTAEQNRLYFDIIIFDHYKELIENMDDNDTVVVGVVRDYTLSRQKVAYPITIKHGEELCLFPTISIPDNSDYVMSDVRSRCLKNFVVTYMHKVLRAWYGIQLSLLHPTIKIAMKNKYGIQSDQSRYTHDCSERTTEYVRYYHIKSPVGLKVDDHNKLYNRKVKAWYVVGHWRQYKTGKKIFIQGYWKGEFRELKRNLDNGRKRRIQPSISIINKENTD